DCPALLPGEVRAKGLPRVLHLQRRLPSAIVERHGALERWRCHLIGRLPIRDRDPPIAPVDSPRRDERLVGIDREIEELPRPTLIQGAGPLADQWGDAG